MKKSINQNGSMHIMIVVVIISLFLIGALYFVFSKNFVSDNKEKDVVAKRGDPVTNVVTSKTVNVPVDDTSSPTSPAIQSDGYNIETLGRSIYFPKGYTVEKNQEDNRFGSFVSYDFRIIGSNTYLSELRLYDNDSIGRFVDKHSENEPLPPEGDYFGRGDFDKLKNCFNNKSDCILGNITYKYSDISSSHWLIASHDYTARKAGYQREYITFNDIIMVGLYIHTINASHINEADILAEKISI